jgi:TPR repeat protein
MNETIHVVDAGLKCIALKSVPRLLIIGGICVLVLSCSKDASKPTPAASAAPSSAKAVGAPTPTAAAANPTPAAPAASAGEPTCDPDVPRDCEQKCLGGDGPSCGFADALLRKGADNPKLRAQLNQKGCDLGNLKSCGRLADQYDKGDGVARDRTKALAMEEQTCERGHANACSLAGSMYGSWYDTRTQDLNTFT